MRSLIYTSLFFLGIVATSQSQNLEDIEFGTDDTFEVVTWNIEWFPKRGFTTIDSVEVIVNAIDADVYAIQEIDNLADFEWLASRLSNYDLAIVEDDFSGLGFLYKTSTVQVNSIMEILENSNKVISFGENNSVTVTKPFAANRVPLILDVTFNEEQFYILNNHLKASESGNDGLIDYYDPWDEETRRLASSLLIEEYVSTNLNDKKVIVVGDLNDILTDETANNVFTPFLDKPSEYLFADMDIATGSNANWSYPSWPSHLDHILITNELFDAFNHSNSSITTLRIDDYLSGGWTDYDTNISDHRPVGLKLDLNNSLSTDNITHSQFNFKASPNPAQRYTELKFSSSSEKRTVEVFNLLGQKVIQQNIEANTDRYSLDLNSLSNGIYLVNLKEQSRSLAHLKIIVSN